MIRNTIATVASVGGLKDRATKADHSDMRRRIAVLAILAANVLVAGALIACEPNDSAAPPATTRAAQDGHDGEADDHHRQADHHDRGTDHHDGRADDDHGRAAAPAAPSSGPCAMFPADNPWNTDVSGFRCTRSRRRLSSSIGATRNLHPDFGTVWDGGPIGIPYVSSAPGQPKVPVAFDYADESDPGPYPMPPDAPIEGGAASDGRPARAGDRRRASACCTRCSTRTRWTAARRGTRARARYSTSRSNALRPDFWTSADAAGLPIYPGSCATTRSSAGRDRPRAALHGADDARGLHPPGDALRVGDTDAEPAADGRAVPHEGGLHVRGVQPPRCKVICAALKRYGMFVADNGSDWYMSGAPNSRWNDDAWAT